MYDQERLKGIERLHGALEADGTRLNLVLNGRLRHDRSNEVIRQNMRPDLFAYQFWRLAAKDVHVERVFERTQIEFNVPASAIQCPQVIRSCLHRIKQGRHDDNRLRPKSGLGYPNESFADRDKLRQRFVGFAIQRTDGRRLPPGHRVVVFA